MISRQWRCLLKPGKDDDYVSHLQRETFPAIRRIDGFVDAWIMRRVTPAGSEFVIETRWESLDAIRKFAGADAEVAVVPRKAAALMAEFDARVRHFEVL
jgi:heme-degrading monooxygenase HmoA